jgi:hypothetical protein
VTSPSGTWRLHLAPGADPDDPVEQLAAVALGVLLEQVRGGLELPEGAPERIARAIALRARPLLHRP